MLGMRLLDLEASDALDVLHVLLEEDAVGFGEKHLQARSRVRGVIRNELYGVHPHAPRTAGGPDAHAPPAKHYIPPTPMDDLPAILGAPLD